MISAEMFPCARSFQHWDQSEAVGTPEADNVGSNALVSTVCDHQTKGERSRALGRLSNKTTLGDDDMNSISSCSRSSWNDDKGSRTGRGSTSQGKVTI